MNDTLIQLFRVPRDLRQSETLDEMCSLLLTLRYFRKLKKKNPALLRKCAQSLELCNYKSGEVVFKYGDKSMCFYTLIRGQVDFVAPRKSFANMNKQNTEGGDALIPTIYHHQRDRYSKLGQNFLEQQRQQVKKHLVAGDFFGEEGLMSNKARQYTAICTVDVIMLELGRKSYEDIIKDFDLERDKRDKHTKFTIQLFNCISTNNSFMLQIYLCFEKFEYLANQFLFQEGDTADCIFVVKSGEVILLKDKTSDVVLTEDVVGFYHTTNIKNKRVPSEFAVINSGFVGEEFVESLIGGGGDFHRAYSAQCKSKSKIYKLSRGALTNILHSQMIRDYFTTLIRKKTSWRDNFLLLMKQNEPKQLIREHAQQRNPLNPLEYRKEVTHTAERPCDVIRSRPLVVDFSPIKDAAVCVPPLNLVILHQIKKSQMSLSSHRKDAPDAQHTRSLARMLQSRRSPSIVSVRPFDHVGVEMQHSESALLMFQRSRFRLDSVLDKITVAAHNKLCSKHGQKMNAQEFLGVQRKPPKSIFQGVQQVVQRMRLKLGSQVSSQTTFTSNYTKHYESSRTTPTNLRMRSPQRQARQYFFKKSLVIVGQTTSANVSPLKQ